MADGYPLVSKWKNSCATKQKRNYGHRLCKNRWGRVCPDCYHNSRDIHTLLRSFTPYREGCSGKWGVAKHSVGRGHDLRQELKQLWTICLVMGTNQLGCLLSAIRQGFSNNQWVDRRTGEELIQFCSRSLRKDQGKSSARIYACASNGTASVTVKPWSPSWNERDYRRITNNTIPRSVKATPSSLSVSSSYKESLTCWTATTRSTAATSFVVFAVSV